jgi:hypothetical protein
MGCQGRKPSVCPTGLVVKPSILKAILTDSHFWAPVVVLALGIALLVFIK